MNQQDPGDEQEPTASEELPYGHRGQRSVSVPEGDVAVSPPETCDPSTKVQEQVEAEKREPVSAEQQETEGGYAESGEEEGKGVKRKIEELQEETEAGQSPEKKKVENYL